LVLRDSRCAPCLERESNSSKLASAFALDGIVRGNVITVRNVVVTDVGGVARYVVVRRGRRMIGCMPKFLTKYAYVSTLSSLHPLTRSMFPEIEICRMRRRH
jgi:hypothetical protein